MIDSLKKVQVSRILHAGYVLQSSEASIAFDCIFENPFSRNCYAFPEVHFDYKKIQSLHFDAVFISHFHDDHFSLESLNLLNRETPIYFFCVFEEMFSLLKELGFKNINSLDINQPVRIKNFEVIPRRALDADVDSLFQIKIEGLNILNVVDSWIDYETLDLLVEQGPWDLIMWPFQTMRELEVISPSFLKGKNEDIPFEWIEQLKKLKPRIVIPSSCQFIHESWSWYRKAYFPTSYKKFKSTVEKALSGCEVLRLNPSQSLALREDTVKFAQPLDWVHPVGDQNVDYEYDPRIIPQTTAEISQKFPALSSEEAASVLNFCKQDLLRIYQGLESTETFFNKERNWQLSVYDSAGFEHKFYYQITEGHIAIASEKPQSIHWRTEVPMTRLHAALKSGETLTSMYVRINEGAFDEETKRDLQEVDILADPLVKCLFSGSVSDYQKAQLRRLRENSTNLTPPMS